MGGLGNDAYGAIGFGAVAAAAPPTRASTLPSSSAGRRYPLGGSPVTPSLNATPCCGIMEVITASGRRTTSSSCKHRATVADADPPRHGSRRKRGDCMPTLRSSGDLVSNETHRFAMLGQDPIATIDRDDLKAKLDRGEPIKLVMALNRWAFDAKHIPGSLHFDSPDQLYAELSKDDEIIVLLLQRLLPGERCSVPSVDRARLSQRPALRGRVA